MEKIKEKRIYLDDEIRKNIFSKLKQVHKVQSYRGLAKVLGINNSTLDKWVYGQNYIPMKIFPEGLLDQKLIVDIKEEGWGKSKGGKIGISQLRKIYPLKIRRRWSIKGGLKTVKNLEKTKKIMKPQEINLARVRKIIRLIEIKNNELYFTNNEFPNLNTDKLATYNENKDIVLPKILDENLAEEIGIHIGDGTLVESRNYYSLRGYSIDEHEYYLNHVSILIKKVYGFEPKIFVRKSICGFEKCSKLLFDFKTKIIGLPYGKKSHIIDIPDIIKKSNNEKLILACIRGILDSDGCIWFSKNGTYPRIELFSMSTYLIGSLEFYLDKIGFKTCVNKKRTNITIYGKSMLDLWLNRIGTNQPKNKLKIAIWKVFGKCPSKLVYPELKKLLNAPVM